MKQEVTGFSQSTEPAARVRFSRNRDSPRPESAIGMSPGLKARPKLAPSETNNGHKARRSIPLNKLKPGEEEEEEDGAPRERETECAKVSGRLGNRSVEQYSLRRRMDTGLKGSEGETDGKVKQLQQRLHASESLVEKLQSEVLALNSQLEKMQSLNVELESQNKWLAKDLKVALEKISTHDQKIQVSLVNQEIQPAEFREVRKIIADKLNNFGVKREVTTEKNTFKSQSLDIEHGDKSVKVQPSFVTVKPSRPPSLHAFVSQMPPPPPPPPVQHSPVRGPPPPPPPPPSRQVPPRGGTVQKAAALVELYNSLKKQDGRKKAPMGTSNGASHLANDAHNSIVGEIQNRSAHLLAIKADVQTKGDLIRSLIEKVQTASYTDIEDVLTFVDWIDRELSTLADERAVLKHFNWPERKADALREAAFEYRDLKRVELEASSFQDDASLPCDVTLKKIVSLLDRLEGSIHRLIKFRDTTMPSYKEYKIPTDWMLDSGMVSKIKLASVSLAKVYMKRVSMELKSIQYSDKETTQDALLFQGVHFAYRTHQFAGGLDFETMCAFEELRKQVQTHGRGLRQQLPGITLS